MLVLSTERAEVIRKVWNGLDQVRSAALVHPANQPYLLYRYSLDQCFREVRQGTGLPGEKELLLEEFQNHFLRNWFLKDLDSSREYVAYALPYIDSTKLPADIRVGLELTPEPMFGKAEDENEPLLFTPTENQSPQFLCSNSEWHLERSLRRREGEVADTEPSFRLLDCLDAKRYELIAGACTETKEFPNGAVFLEGVWYLLRDFNLVQQLRELADQSDKTPPGVVYQQEQNQPAISYNLVNWANCAGIWEPNRRVGSLKSPIFSLTFGDLL